MNLKTASNSTSKDAVKLGSTASMHDIQTDGAVI